MWSHGQRVKVFQLSQLAALAILVAGCERAPDIDQPNSYDKGGIAFSFPGNWSVSEDVTEPGELEYRHIFVESPGNAIVIIQRYSPGIDLTVEEFAKQFLEGTIEETESLIELGPIKPLTATGGDTAPVQSLVAGSMRGGGIISVAIACDVCYK